MITSMVHPRRLKAPAVLLASTLYGMLAGSSAWADDTEIFFPVQVIEEDDSVVRPNILFLMDTSGSMASTDGTGQTRLRRVQDALLSILDDLNPNVNIGIGRLSSSEGGAILWPVSPIDSAAADIYPNLASQSVTTRSNGSTNEAQQIVSTVTTSPASLTVGEVTSTPPGSVAFKIVRVANEAEQYSGGRVDSDGGGGSRDSGDIELREANDIDPGIGDNRTIEYVGLRYEGVSLPAGASITSAKIRFTCSNGGETSALNNVDIRGHDVNFSDRFQRGNNNNISNRYGSDTDATVEWDNVGACNSAGTTVETPNISSIVNEIRARSGWSEGNPITILFDLTNTTGGQRTMRSLQGGNQDVAPQLILEFSQPAITLGQRLFGVKFDNVNIPKGVTVTSANILFYSNPASATATQNGQALTATIAIEASDNAAAFAAVNSNVSSRSAASTTTWDVPISTNAQEEVLTPNLSSLINSVVNRSGWCGGNSMVFSFSRSSGSGIRTFMSSATDAALTPVLSLTYSSADTALDTGCQSNSATSQAASSSDDAEQRVSNGNVTLDSSDLELGFDGSNKQVVGTKFNNLSIPQGATIRSAYIQFTAKDASSGTVNLTISGESTDTASSFSTTNSSLSTRAKTTATVNWSPGSWSGETLYNSPDLTSVVQEIVNRAGWSRGNEMAFYITTSSASGTRRAYSEDGSASKAPKLVIKFDSPPGRLTTRTYLKQVVEDFVADGTTPLPEMLYEAAQYYRGDQVHYGKTRGDGDSDASNGVSATGGARISHPAAIDFSRSTPNTEASLYSIPATCTSANYNSSSCAAERIAGTAYYRSPLTQQECTTNSIVLLSDGLPNNTQDASITRMQNFVGKSCEVVGSSDGDSNDGTCGKEIAEYLLNNDQASSQQGLQTVKTYTIGFANAGASSYLESISDAGGGDFFAASDAQGVVEAFREIVSSILDIGTTFVSPAVTVNTFNRLTTRDELYFALFRPQPQTRWEGNLKRYQLGGNPPVIRDADNLPAVDDATGFFKTTARSVWTPSGTDDGDNIALGGMIGVFPASRSVFTYTGTATALDAGGTSAPAEVTLSTTANQVIETNTAITKQMLGDSGMSDADRTNALKYGRGVDVLDDDGDGDLTDLRRSMGDPLHSEPILLTYGGTAASPDLTVFVGTNEGALHAVNAQTGVEQFAFFPQELLPNLNTYYQNATGYLNRPYGVDGLITAFVPDPFASISNSNKATLYFGLRMGGRQIYALDVTDRSNPKLKFVIRGDGSGKYRELGQSWSRVNVAQIKFNGAARRVIIFTGGYDIAQDGKALPNSSGDSMGRAVYIADALTGERLWWGGIDPDGLADNPDVAIPAMQYSIPASPRAVDIDGDGLVDRIYVVDVAGQLFRFILNPANTGSTNLVPSGNWRKIAQLGGGATSVNARRFYSAPDIAIIRQNVSSPFLSISLGSGHRGHPLEEATQDRFYVLRDPDELVGENTSNLFITDMANQPNSGDQPNLYDASDDLVSSDDEDISGPALEALNASKGFFIDLPATGEKALNESQTFDGKVLFTTYQPAATVASEVCQASTGLSRFYALSIRDGSPVFNLDGTGTDDDLTTSDRSRELGTQGLPPNLAILYPPAPDGEDPTALIGVGPELIPVELNIPIKKTYWIKRR